MEPTKVEIEILEAAKELFLDKGFSATSTTDIAKKAGCNQALVHYYYRTKENLFQKIFLQEVETMLTIVGNTFDDELPLNQNLERAVGIYFNALEENPKAAMFIVQELWMNPDRRSFIRENFVKNELRAAVYERYCAYIQKEIENGSIVYIEPWDLLMNAVSLVISTFLSLPIVSDLLEMDSNHKHQYVEGRKKEIIKLLSCRLRP